MEPYSPFAKFYDASMGDRQSTSRLINDLIRKYNPKAKSVLELACGTGEILKSFYTRYEVAGLDISPEMIKAAKRKMPKVAFYCQDMTKFKLAQKFDVVFCVFDSLNHVLKFSSWEKVFKRAAEHLNPDGVFIFDINTVHKLKRLSAQPAAITEFNGNYLIMKVSDIGRGITNWNLKVFEKKGPAKYGLTQTNIKEISFSVPEIKKSLTGHFSKVQFYDKNFNRPNKETPRIFFICQK